MSKVTSNDPDLLRQAMLIDVGWVQADSGLTLGGLRN
jgi:hypothetical protein